MSDEHFEARIELPREDLDARRRGLIGFEPRFERLQRDLEIMLDPQSVRGWSQEHHGTVLPICEQLADRHPLVIFHGDVGTGKTATAESCADRLARDRQQDATLLKLSTRVRGTGLHGEMTRLMAEAFDQVKQAAGKKRLAFLIIDEGDALAASREGAQLHQEEKAGTNTLIQRLDDLRALRGRAVVFLATNRLHAVDPAIVRRAARLERFARPDEQERRELLNQELHGLGLDKKTMDTLVRLTGPKGERLGLTFSDLRTRLLPNAILMAYPGGPLTREALLEAARTTEPSPSAVS